MAEMAFFWSALAAYVAAAGLAIWWSAGAKSERLMIASVWFTTAGACLQSASIAIRWIGIGHGPYFSRYESMIANALAIALVFLLMQARFKEIRAVAPYALSAVVLAMGVAALSPKTAEPLPLTFQSYWLVVHIWFAKFANGALLLGAACAAAFLYKARKARKLGAQDIPFEQADSELQWLDEFSYKLTAFGFISLALMIGSGSMWANQSWGSYWSWDAVETWSLVAWLVYGVYLHLRRTFGWKGEKAAYLLLACLGIAIVSLFLIGVIYTGLHREFLGPT